ncbi:hypothetical protein E5D57_007521 [Metarhizium anisopliae]|nr:hypothetical protein E5D57_007521 [Metarhizium anisopliae]
MYDLVTDQDSIKLIEEFYNAGKPVAAVQLSAAMPFLLEDELKKVGANFHAADQPWGEKVVVDGLIISGQNPASARGVGEAIAKAIGV